MDDDSYCTSIQLVDIEEPSHLDVLCGRGLGTNRHNTYFRNLVQSKQELYAKSTKSEKMAITRSIVQIVRECGGRFLDKNPFTERWNDVGDRKAIEKTSQALRDGAPTRKKDQFSDEHHVLCAQTTTHPFIDYSDTNIQSPMKQPALIPSDEIHEAAPKQTFQQHFMGENDEAMHSPKIRKLQQRPIKSHRRSYTNEEVGEWQFVTPSGVRNKSKVVLSIFRPSSEFERDPAMTPAHNFVTRMGSFSPRTLYAEYSRSRYPISRCYSEPMDRESLPSHLAFPPLDQCVPMVFSFLEESETEDDVVPGHDISHLMRGSRLDDGYALTQTMDSYHALPFKQTKADFMCSSPTILHRTKQAPFDWMDSPVISRMEMHDNTEIVHEGLPCFPRVHSPAITRMQLHENMETVREGIPSFPRVPSWTNFVTPEKNVDTDPLPYNDRLDQFPVSLETVQSFLEAESATEELMERKCDESSVATDILPFSLPDIIDPNGRSNGANISPLTTPNCDTSYDLVSTDGDACGSPSNRIEEMNYLYSMQ